MASYNEIDGIPSHANRWLLHDVLRGEWGYQGAVVSDYYGIRELMTRHQLFDNITDAAGRRDQAGRRRRDPRRRGLCSIARTGPIGPGPAGADRSRRCAASFGMKFESGLFDNPFPDAATADGEDRDSRRHRARPRSGGQAMVLLQERSRPAAARRRRRSSRMAVIGTHARDTPHRRL